MAVGRHFENGFIAITQPGIIRFQRNLVCSRKLRFPRTVTWQSATILQIQHGKQTP